MKPLSSDHVLELAAVLKQRVGLNIRPDGYGALRIAILARLEDPEPPSTDPEAYLGAAAMLGFEPSEVMMVAAHKDDLRAAQACGLAAAFVRRPREKGPKAKLDLAPEADFDVNARDFVDLARRLARRPPS